MARPEPVAFAHALASPIDLGDGNTMRLGRLDDDDRWRALRAQAASHVYPSAPGAGRTAR
jgi:hypothetical protein